MVALDGVGADAGPVHAAVRPVAEPAGVLRDALSPLGAPGDHRPDRLHDRHPAIERPVGARTADCYNSVTMARGPCEGPARPVRLAGPRTGDRRPGAGQHRRLWTDFAFALRQRVRAGAGNL